MLKRLFGNRTPAKKAAEKEGQRDESWGKLFTVKQGLEKLLREGPFESERLAEAREAREELCRTSDYGPDFSHPAAYTHLRFAYRVLGLTVSEINPLSWGSGRFHPVYFVDIDWPQRTKEELKEQAELICSVAEEVARMYGLSAMVASPEMYAGGGYAMMVGLCTPEYAAEHRKQQKKKSARAKKSEARKR